MPHLHELGEAVQWSRGARWASMEVIVGRDLFFVLLSEETCRHGQKSLISVTHIAFTLYSAGTFNSSNTSPFDYDLKIPSLLLQPSPTSTLLAPPPPS